MLAYEKLEVHTAMDAVIKARALGLIVSTKWLKAEGTCPSLLAEDIMQALRYAVPLAEIPDDKVYLSLRRNFAKENIMPQVQTITLDEIIAIACKAAALSDAADKEGASRLIWEKYEWFQKYILTHQ